MIDSANSKTKFRADPQVFLLNLWWFFELFDDSVNILV